MKTRKILSVLLAVTMLIGLIPAFTVSLAADVDDLEFELDWNGNAYMDSYCVSSCNQRASGELVIPDTFNGKSVTGIDDYAFYDCTGLTSITIPDTVTGIGVCVFKGCTGLTALNVSADNVAFSSINGVLYNKSQSMLFVYPSAKLNTSCVIPDSVSSICYRAFEGCTRLTSVTIPNSVTSVGDFAFKRCTGLTSITIPNSVTSIGDEAFEGCMSLTNITIPDSVTNMGIYALFNTAWYNSKPDGLVYAGKVAYGYKGSMSENTSIVLANGTRSIACGMFRNRSGLTNITIPDSVISIGKEAFYRCDNIKINCNHASYAESYAINNGVPYVIIGGIVSNILDVSRGVISGLNCGDSLGATLAKLNSSANVKVFDLDGNEITDSTAKVGTGMVLKKFNNSGAVKDEVVVSVLGDVDGNGKTTTDDARATLRAAVGLNSFSSSAQELAAEVDGEAGVTTSDARKLLRVAVGLDTL